MLNNIWYGGQIRNAAGALVPRLFTGPPKLIKKKPLTVRATFKKEAVWSDGRPVTGRDFRATWQVFVNPQHNPISRTGYEDIRSVAGNGKTFTVVFKKVYADWETLVSSGVYPAHVVNGTNMNNMFLSSVPLSSGPWVFDSWQKGVQITVRKNARFKAGPPMKLNRVVFRYILDTNARFQALKANEGQVMEPQPQLQIADFMRDRAFTVHRKIGFAWEHIDIQYGDKGHPALKKRFVREALIRGMNRNQVAEALYGTIAPGLRPVQSHIYKPFEKYYKQPFAQYGFNQTKALNVLRSNGCTGGPSRPSSSNSDIFSCPGVGKLSFRFSTTTGNQLRALTFEIVQRQLKSVGIELLSRFQVAGTLFGTTLPSSDWDLIMYTSVGSPSSPIGSAPDVWKCGGAQNYMNYCNRKASVLMNKVSVELGGPAAVASLWHKAEAMMARDIPSIPVYARPIFVIRRNTVNGPTVNPTNEGSPWNIALWTS